MASVLRLAVWSGPRNISTALMRSWGSRADTLVVDEPFYARYLAITGADHPGRDEVVRAGETDYTAIVRAMTAGEAPAGIRVHYQKQMAHHLLEGDDLSWIDGVTNCFLIRDPAEMIASFVKVVASPSPEQLGIPQQAAMFERERARTGREPLVVDAKDLLASPEAMLRAWCVRVGLEFDPAMLAWAPGPRATDGVWAPHWYDAVLRSTGFEPWRPRDVRLPASLRPVLDECRRWYDVLFQNRLRA